MIDDRSSTLPKFPTISGRIVKLRELSIDDALEIGRLMTYNISKLLWEVPYPYTLKMHGALLTQVIENLDR
jgi:hypothetical protein